MLMDQMTDLHHSIWKSKCSIHPSEIIGTDEQIISHADFYLKLMTPF